MSILFHWRDLLVAEQGESKVKKGNVIWVLAYNLCAFGLGLGFIYTKTHHLHFKLPFSAAVSKKLNEFSSSNLDYRVAHCIQHNYPFTHTPLLNHSFGYNSLLPFILDDNLCVCVFQDSVICTFVLKISVFNDCKSVVLMKFVLYISSSLILLESSLFFFLIKVLS